jgi:hypothetical protein
VFFPYPKQCQLKRNEERLGTAWSSCKLKFKITDSVCTYNCVVSALKAAGFVQTEGKNWNVLWSAPLQPEVLRNFNKYQRCNHFPNTWQLGRKDNLWKNVNRYSLFYSPSMRRKFGEEYEICPQTYLMPEDHKRLTAERETDPKALWILKPVASSCGRGIRLLGASEKAPRKQ